MSSSIKLDHSDLGLCNVLVTGLYATCRHTFNHTRSAVQRRHNKIHNNIPYLDVWNPAVLPECAPRHWPLPIAVDDCQHGTCQPQTAIILSDQISPPPISLSRRNAAQKGNIHENYPHTSASPPSTRPRHPPQPQRDYHPEPARDLPPPRQSPAVRSRRRVLFNLVRNHRTRPVSARNRKTRIWQDQLQGQLPQHAMGPADAHLRAGGRGPAHSMAHRRQPARRTRGSREGSPQRAVSARGYSNRMQHDACLVREKGAAGCVEGAR